MESNAIRLTNRTAIALRRQAKRTRNAYFVMGAVGTLLLLALAVYLGMMWLPAVPLLLALAVATDALLALSARRMYLQLIGQAICTEAAARRIRAEKDWLVSKSGYFCRWICSVRQHCPIGDTIISSGRRP